MERFLAYLTDIERSPNTVKAYAHDLKDYWVFLAYRGLEWREVRLEDIGAFVGWLRLPPAGRDGAVAVLPPTGFAGSGPSRAYQRFAVPPGRHELTARLRDTDRAEGFDYERMAVVELAPAQSLAIDFRAEMGGFIFR